MRNRPRLQKLFPCFFAFPRLRSERFDIHTVDPCVCVPFTYADVCLLFVCGVVDALVTRYLSALSPAAIDAELHALGGGGGGLGLMTDSPTYEQEKQVGVTEHALWFPHLFFLSPFFRESVREETLNRAGNGRGARRQGSAYLCESVSMMCICARSLLVGTVLHAAILQGGVDGEDQL